MKPQYDIIFSEQTLNKIHDYHKRLISGKNKPGEHLNYKLEKSKQKFKNLSLEKFIELLLSTKKPKIFPEREIRGNGKDWNNHELSILGDINVRMPVEIYDNGVWQADINRFKPHNQPFKGDLLFTPGALLHTCSQFEGPIPDLMEISSEGKINQESYNSLVERRILPVLAKINEQAKKINKSALVVMPGIGGGEFSGHFIGKMGEHLNIAMQALLKKHAPVLKEIDVIHYDPYNEGKNQEKKFGHLKYRVRPQLADNFNKTQLSMPKNYQENGENFKNHHLFKLVSWDQPSLPGNDYFGGMRFTDNGMSAAATNSMQVLTGKKGKYDKNEGKYLPPKNYRTWEEVAQDTILKINGNLYIVKDDGSIHTLNKKDNSLNKLNALKTKKTTTASVKNTKVKTTKAKTVPKSVVKKSDNSVIPLVKKEKLKSPVKKRIKLSKEKENKINFG